MSKEMIFDAEARRALCAGFSKLADVVRITLGPRGRHVALQGPLGIPTITNDSTLIAQEIELPDPFENMGARLGKEINQRAHAETGDGATTATVLAQSLLVRGSMMVDGGVNPVCLKRGLEAAAQEVQQALSRQAKKPDLSRFRGWVGEDLLAAQRIEEAIQLVGKKGIVSISSSESENDRALSVCAGFEIDQGYLSPYFVTDPQTMECRLEDVWILLCQGTIDSFRNLVPVLEQVAGSGKALLILAEEIESEALATLVVNSLRGSLRVAAVQAPGWGAERGRQLEDLAVLTGGRVLDPESGFFREAMEASAFGWAHEVTVGKGSTVLRGAGGDTESVARRLKEIRELAKKGSLRNQRLLEERINRLSSCVAVIHVGNDSASKIAERRTRYEDILLAALSARDEGVVTGGGVALLRAGQGLPDVGSTDEEKGAALLKASLGAPLGQIAANAGWDGGEVVSQVSLRDDPVGFNARVCRYQDLSAAGVMDAHKVVRCALGHAVSIAGIILTTETLVADIEDCAGEE